MNQKVTRADKDYAFYRGGEDRKEGLEFRDNPFEWNFQLWTAWQGGWIDYGNQGSKK